jgi:hypothetical protein
MVLSSYRIAPGAYQYGRTRPGVGDRILVTWDVHGVLEDFCKALKMTLPTGDDVYVTAKGQFDWFKEELSVPELTYNDLMRLVETWIMGVPGEEVCAMSCLCVHLHAKPRCSPPGKNHHRRENVYSCQGRAITSIAGRSEIFCISHDETVS